MSPIEKPSGPGIKKRLKLDKKKVWKNLVSRPMILVWIGATGFVVVSSLIPQAGLTETSSGLLGLDKLARIAVFAVISFLPIAFFASAKMGIVAATFMPPLGFVLEIAQKNVPGRHFSPEDIIANNIGAVAGIALALTIRILFHTGGRRFRKKDPEPVLRPGPSPSEVQTEPIEEQS